MFLQDISSHVRAELSPMKRRVMVQNVLHVVCPMHYRVRSLNYQSYCARLPELVPLVNAAERSNAVDELGW